MSSDEEENPPPQPALADVRINVDSDVTENEDDIGARDGVSDVMEEDSDVTDGAAGGALGPRWEGVPLEDMMAIGKSAPAQYPPLEPSRYRYLGTRCQQVREF